MDTKLIEILKDKLDKGQFFEENLLQMKINIAINIFLHGYGLRFLL
jgi:hypothetical protein